MDYDIPAPIQVYLLLKQACQITSTNDCLLELELIPGQFFCKYLVRVTAKHFGACFGNPLPSIPSSFAFPAAASKDSCLLHPQILAGPPLGEEQQI